jgi:hypothetical protein
LKLFIILYADTVILSESESDLQAQLDAFHEYCLTWKLKVNTDKTKIVIVGSGRTPQNLSFKRNRSTRRKPPTCRKSLTNFITYNRNNKGIFIENKDVNRKLKRGCF